MQNGGSIDTVNYVGITVLANGKLSEIIINFVFLSLNLPKFNVTRQYSRFLSVKYHLSNSYINVKILHIL